MSSNILIIYKTFKHFFSFSLHYFLLLEWANFPNLGPKKVFYSILLLTSRSSVYLFTRSQWSGRQSNPPLTDVLHEIFSFLGRNCWRTCGPSSVSSRSQPTLMGGWQSVSACWPASRPRWACWRWAAWSTMWCSRSWSSAWWVKHQVGTCTVTHVQHCPSATPTHTTRRRC